MRNQQFWPRAQTVLLAAFRSAWRRMLTHVAMHAPPPSIEIVFNTYLRYF